jgi:hypothetical protein
MEDHVSCDIRRMLYLWVYLTAENPEVTGKYKDFLSRGVAADGVRVQE